LAIKDDMLGDVGPTTTVVELVIELLAAIRITAGGLESCLVTGDETIVGRHASES
jgi:hypothetical protein